MKDFSTNGEWGTLLPYSRGLRLSAAMAGKLGPVDKVATPENAATEQTSFWLAQNRSGTAQHFSTFNKRELAQDFLAIPVMPVPRDGPAAAAKSASGATVEMVGHAVLLQPDQLGQRQYIDHGSAR